MVKISCDFCASAAATLICCAEDVALCDECDATVHSANNLAGRHERVSLIDQELQRKCDVCKDSKGLLFCVEHRSLLCRNCDIQIHSGNRLSLNSAHRRFLVSGISVGDLKQPESSSHSHVQELPSAVSQTWDDGDIFAFNPPPILYTPEDNYDNHQNVTDELWSFESQRGHQG